MEDNSKNLDWMREVYLWLGSQLLLKSIWWNLLNCREIKVQMKILYLIIVYSILIVPKYYLSVGGMGLTRFGPAILTVRPWGMGGSLGLKQSYISFLRDKWNSKDFVIWGPYGCLKQGGENGYMVFIKWGGGILGRNHINATITMGCLGIIKGTTIGYWVNEYWVFTYWILDKSHGGHGLGWNDPWQPYLMPVGSGLGTGGPMGGGWWFSCTCITWGCCWFCWVARGTPTLIYSCLQLGILGWGRLVKQQMGMGHAGFWVCSVRSSILAVFDQTMVTGLDGVGWVSSLNIGGKGIVITSLHGFGDAGVHSAYTDEDAKGWDLRNMGLLLLYFSIIKTLVHEVRLGHLWNVVDIILLCLLLIMGFCRWLVYNCCGGYWLDWVNGFPFGLGSSMSKTWHNTSPKAISWPRMWVHAWAHFLSITLFHGIHIWVGCPILVLMWCVTPFYLLIDMGNKLHQHCSYVRAILTTMVYCSVHCMYSFFVCTLYSV
ncbi:hypothetical protein R6Q59_028592 [Mikania micrantha]